MTEVAEEEKPKTPTFTIAEIAECIHKLNEFMRLSQEVKQFIAAVFQQDGVAAKPKSSKEALLEEMLSSMFRSMGLRSSEVKTATEAVKRALPKEVVYGAEDSNK
jgi:hypothetical protein